MVKRKISYAREAALRSLLDDDSLIVQGALEAEFRRLGDIGLMLLQKITREGHRPLCFHAQNLLEKIQGPNPVAQWFEFIRSLQYELETGCIFLGRTLTPSLEAAEVVHLLDTMGRRTRELSLFPGNPLSLARVINRVLYHEFGFRGEFEDIENPEYNFLHLALRRRKASPLMMSVIYVLVARRCRLDLEFVHCPGASLVAWLGDLHPFYIDPYEGGKLAQPEDYLTETQVRQLHQSTQVPFPSIPHLPAIPTSEILREVCRQLARQYHLRNDPARARLYQNSLFEFEKTHRRLADS
jgi:regulator of sirC expression with transglutaminase-like and TPR domain